MSTGDELQSRPNDETAADNPSSEGTQAAEEPERRLDLKVDIADAGPCKKHIKVSIPTADIERQFDDSLKSMRREAQVPGFRPGRAPVVLVQKRFKKEVAGQVKQSLVVAALDQIDKDYKLAPITRPDLDIEAIELTEGKPLTFELEVEVQPEFELPEYKGLKVDRPTRPITDADIAKRLTQFLDHYAQEIPKPDGVAELGDQITARLAFSKDGVAVSEVPEARFRLQNELLLRDGRIPEIDSVLKGTRIGDTRETKIEIGSNCPDPAIRSQTIDVRIDVLDLKSFRQPELTSDFLGMLGFDDADALRQAVREMLERRARYAQNEAVRRAVLDQLLEKTPFDLPPDLVRRQVQQTLRRNIMELRQAGMSESEIRAREATLRANAQDATHRSLKEFFLLSKIADAESIKVEEPDIDAEIERMAEQADESPRRVRSRIEKDGLADSLYTRILENKAIEAILAAAEINDVTIDDAPAEPEIEAIDEGAGPEANDDDQAEPEDSTQPAAE